MLDKLMDYHHYYSLFSTVPPPSNIHPASSIFANSYKEKKGKKKFKKKITKKKKKKQNKLRYECKHICRSYPNESQSAMYHTFQIFFYKHIKQVKHNNLYKNTLSVTYK